MTIATVPPLLNTTTLNPTSLKKPVRVRKPPKATTPAAAAAAALNSTSNSSEVPATVKELPAKPNALTLARLPEIDEIPITDLDLGYLFPSNFAPKSPAPFESIGSRGIL